ncbi:hypothetical protein [Granulosicoccus antarcticus]|uniref:JmjC domain-containing protein n=1 Tax=Granulosicoccus antarcticus IMCC3135 TaxID=1192854 RepID=A0A2Z2P8A6_9GAMM|nr:hypothetical protein [Granulosicoccus antarcticus]ASJ76084.1 hypothetical protein IMCC3135_30175 [Granulosicoccus antarcticus IMCC3135]
MSQSQVLHPIAWSDEEYQSFGKIPQVSKHRYHELPLFDTDVLIALLDAYPRKHLQAYTMGTDPKKNSDWRQVDIAEGTCGADLWRAAESGRIWLNLVNIESNRQEYRELIDSMYAHLGEHCPHLQNPKATHSALLISSPGAQVYYHLDAEPNMLWHLRGEKDVWLYPAMDPELVPQNYLEDIYAGEIGENLPYRTEFDKRAVKARLQPGDAASWPHNGPHRIVNVDMNVSLATSYYTPAVYQRQYVQLANRFILRNLGIQNRSMSEQGLVAAAKRMSYRVINKIRPFKRKERSAGYITDLQIDPDGPLGLRQLSEPRLASFGRKSAQSQEEQANAN